MLIIFYRLKLSIKNIIILMFLMLSGFSYFTYAQPHDLSKIPVDIFVNDKRVFGNKIYAQTGDKIQLSLIASKSQLANWLVNWHQMSSIRSHIDEVSVSAHKIIYRALPFQQGAAITWQAEAGSYLFRYKISVNNSTGETPKNHVSQSLLSSCDNHWQCNGYLANAISLHIKQPGSRPVDYATELLGVPFVMGPRFIKNVGHSTDLAIATDCAALVTYGLRRAGYPIPYVGPKKITQYLAEPSKKFQISDNILVHPNVLEEGDILHFGHQVSFFYKDVGEKGRLDSDDLLLHSHHDYAAIIPWKNAPYANDKFQVYRIEEIPQID